MKARETTMPEEHLYTKDELKRVQNIGLEMLIEVDRICRKRGIPYEIDGGTLLGAVRYKGFIPWDDDVDVRLVQEDYERFREACRTDLDHERFFFQDYTTDPGYRWGYGKLLRKGTAFYRTGQDMLTMKRGVCIDVFNYIGMPAKGLKKRLFNFGCFLLRKIAYSPIGSENERNPLARTMYRLLKLLPSGVFISGYERINHMYQGAQTGLTRTPGWHGKREDDGYLWRWTEETCELDFEGHLFFAPKDYDGYLRFLYGDDYMTPPPKDQQTHTHGVSRLNLGNCGFEWR